MHKSVPIFEVVLGARSSQIALFVNVDSKIFGNNAPNSQIKLPCLEKKRLFDVLLDDPKLRVLVLLEYEF